VRSFRPIVVSFGFVYFALNGRTDEGILVPVARRKVGWKSIYQGVRVYIGLGRPTESAII
jgi:hypothetical protein